MNDQTKGVDARSASRPKPITLRQSIRATSEDVQQMVSDHYAGRDVSIAPDHVSINVSGGGGSGYSRSEPSFRGVTLRFFGEAAKKAEAEGLPTTLELTPDAVAAIVAKRFAKALGRGVHPSRVDWEVSGGGVAGYSQSGPSLRSALLRFESEV